MRGVGPKCVRCSLACNLNHGSRILGLPRKLSQGAPAAVLGSEDGNRYWPMFDLCLTTPDLHLKHLTEGDLASLADIHPDDAEQNPRRRRIRA